MISHGTESFGSFLRRKRKQKGLTLQLVASQLGIAVSYLSDIEHDRRYPPENRIPRFASILSLSEDETAYLYDLAAKEKAKGPSDISTYLMSHPSALKVIRYARDYDLSNEHWDNIFRTLTQKQKHD